MPEPPKSTENDPLGLLKGPIGASLRLWQMEGSENAKNKLNIDKKPWELTWLLLIFSLCCPNSFYSHSESPISQLFPTSISINPKTFGGQDHISCKQSVFFACVFIHQS